MAGLVGLGLVRLHGWFGWVRVRVRSGVMGVRMGWGAAAAHTGMELTLVGLRKDGRETQQRGEVKVGTLE